MRNLLLLLAGVLAFPFHVAAGARDPDQIEGTEVLVRATDQEMQDLVARLGDRRFKERQQAFEALLDLGADDPVRILAFLPFESADPETAAQCEALRRQVPLAALRRKALALAEGDPVLTGAYADLFGGREPLQDAIRTFSQIRVTGAAAREAAARVLAECFLDHPDHRVRMAALEGLRVFPVPALAVRVEPMIRDESTYVGKLAVSVYRELAGKGASGTLVGILADANAHPLIAQEAAGALLRLSDPAAAPGLLVLLADSDPKRRQHAVYALAGCGDAASAERMGSLLADPAPAVRQCVIGSLAFLGDRGDLGEAPKRAFALRVAPLLADGNIGVRTASADGLARLAGEPSVAALARGLEDPNPLIRFAAVRAIDRIVKEGWGSGEPGVEAARAWWKKHEKEERYRDAGIEALVAGAFDGRPAGPDEPSPKVDPWGSVRNPRTLKAIENPPPEPQ